MCIKGHTPPAAPLHGSAPAARCPQLQQILRLAVSDIVNRIRRNRQTIFAISLLRRCLHYTLHTFHDIIHISKISLTVSIIKDLDLLPGTQLIGKSKIRHVRSSGRSVYGEEPETGRRNIIQLAVGMGQQFIALLCSRVEGNRVVHLVFGAVRHFLLEPYTEEEEAYTRCSTAGSACRQVPEYYRNQSSYSECMHPDW